MGQGQMINARSLLIALTFSAIAVLAGCGGADGDFPTSTAGVQENGQSGPRGSAGGQSNATATPAPLSTPTPPPPQTGSGDPEDGSGGSARDMESVLENEVAQAAEERIIVRTVDMTVESQNVSDSIQEIGQIASLNGGWIVQTQHVEVHRGQINIRVPANRLEDALRSIRQVSANVKSEVSTSQDFTEEFTDTNARINTLQDTVTSLRALFDRAEEIEDALEIQREITSIQSDLESLQARVNFLSQSSAFSLISVEVLALPQPLEISAGEDLLAAASRAVRFRAQFTPPDGIDNFDIEWDFGDGTSTQTTTRVAPVDTEGRVISAPVTHTFADDVDSPYIVRVTVNGTGESGAAEGEDVMVVTVTRVPPIDVFAGESQEVDAGETVKFRGTFTRPEGVEDLVYTWDFGDGSAPVRVEPAGGESIAVAEHTYANHRPQDFEVILTVSGKTGAGSTEGKGTTSITVNEPEALDAGTFAPGDAGKSAFRILSVIGKGIGNTVIFLGVLSPIWIVMGIIVYVVYRTNKRNRERRIARARGLRPETPPPDAPVTR